MKDRCDKIPDVLKRKLFLTGFLALGILVAGIFMEWQQGDGFLKLTLICVVGLAGYFLYQLWLFATKEYDCFEGEVTEIRLCKGTKKNIEIVVTAKDGEKEEFLVPAGSKIWKGKEYSFYHRAGNLLGVAQYKEGL